MCSPLVEDVIHDEEIVSKAAAETLAETLKHHGEYIAAIIDQLLQKYEEKSEVKNLKVFNPIALRKAKIVHNFGLSESSRIKITIEVGVVLM